MKQSSCLLIFLFLSSAMLHAQEALLTVDVLFRNPDVGNCQLSPDGKFVALTTSREGTSNINVLDFSTGKSTQATHEAFDIGDFFWADSERLVYSSSESVAGGSGRLRYYSIDANGSNRQLLTPESPKDDISFMEASLLHKLPEDADHILVSLRPSVARYPGIYKIDIRKALFYQLSEIPGSLVEVFLDEKGIPRFGSAEDGSGRKAYVYQPADKSKWGRFPVAYPGLDKLDPVAIAYSKDIGVAVSNKGRDKSAVFKIHYISGQVSSEPVLSDPDVDIEAEPIYSYGGGGFVGLSYEAPRPKQVFFDNSIKQLHAYLNQLIPDAYNRVISSTGNGDQLVVESISAKRPIHYFLVNLDGMKVRLLAKSHPQLQNQQLRGAAPVSYTASDGQTVHGYLTLPKTYSSRRPVPMIVLLHDGPWTRDLWGLRDWRDYIPEFYASRGFAVLRINYRGSTGFGRKHLASSLGNIERMHQDVIDGVAWAVQKGYADEKRIGLAGTGWGALLALNALVNESSLFRFGICFDPISNLTSHVKAQIGRGSSRDIFHWKSRIGDPDSHQAMPYLIKWSPVYTAQNLKAPILIYSGFPKSSPEGRNTLGLVGALSKAERAFLLVQPAVPGRAPFSEPNRIELFKAVDAFLQKVKEQW
jgi:dipeptidyl aminopeptidase/acylaminoacyl peptidase